MVYLGIVGGIILIETIIKFLVEKLGAEKKKVPVFGGKLYLTKYHNRGAFLDFGAGKAGIKIMSVFLTLICGIIFLFTLGNRGKKPLLLGLSLLFGGALSNSFDRISRGYVVDYFGFAVRWKKLADIVFNLSDFCIMIGSALWVLFGSNDRPSDKILPKSHEKTPVPTEESERDFPLCPGNSKEC